MNTSDFSSVGAFFKGESGMISFVSLAEEQAFKSASFLENKGFKRFDSEIKTSFIEDTSTIYELIIVAKFLSEVKVPVFIGDFKFPELLKINFIKADKLEEDSFPASQLCKALSLMHDSFVPFQTERRLVLTDYGTKLPSSKDEIIVFPNVVKDFKTVYPKSFDSWVKLLLKAKEFKTVNREFLLLKSLFNLK